MRMDPARPDLSKFDAIVGSVMRDAQPAAGGGGRAGAGGRGGAGRVSRERLGTATW